MKQNDYIPIKLNSWAWRLVFHIIFMYHKSLLLCFPNHLKMTKKTCFVLQPYQTGCGPTWPSGNSLGTPGLYSACISHLISCRFNTQGCLFPAQAPSSPDSLPPAYSFCLDHLSLPFQASSSLLFKPPSHHFFPGAPPSPPRSDLPMHTLSMCLSSHS